MLITLVILWIGLGIIWVMQIVRIFPPSVIYRFHKILLRICPEPSREGAISLSYDPQDPHGSIPREPLEEVDDTPDLPQGFGYKMNWLAIRTQDPEKALTALPIDDLQRANWKTGMIAAYRGHTFVTPTIDGWVFVLSHNIPDMTPVNSENHWLTLMEALAEQFEYVQYFGSHRVSDYYAWARFVDGEENRAFEHAGGALKADRGTPTAGELELNHNFFDEDSPEAEEEGYWDREDLSIPSEEDVINVAEKWSLNTTLLGQRDKPLGVGWIGAIRRENSE